jgi:phosphoribosylformylglycinamidine cyclo-ligase
VSEDENAGARAYRSAGVDLLAAARAVELIRDVARDANRPEVAAGVGGFAGLFRLDDGRYLAASSDGVGTKLEVARLAGRLDTVGIDLVAMSANDVVCTGAAPLLFLDYLAVQRVDPEEVAAIVSGVAEGCRRAGCALLGGETAEHPGTLDAGRFDLAGFCVGLASPRDLLVPSGVRPGDLVIGLRSSGLHANGFSLIRKVLLADPARLDEHVPALGRTLGEELLEPTVIYVRTVLELCRAGLVTSAAHITGGGFQENIPRALPAGLGASIDPSAWTPQPIFGLVAAAAGLHPRDLFPILNMGVGMTLVVSPERGEECLQAAREADRIEAAIIGEIVEGSGVRMTGERSQGA